MPEPHAVLNALSAEDARAALLRCCGSTRWVASMMEQRPFGSTATLHADADAAWATVGRDDVLEAFAAHPRIGARATPDAWARQEQARVGDADGDTQRALAAGNAAYLERFGYLFIVCATGKSAPELLALLRARLGNEPARELAIAAREQALITHLRLEKLAA
ncbi:MAG: 2-oxo-4-hydroxy-4-carboxy--5-ureidoimidazoline decarboxylase [Myxococcales bacterium]|nr:2-oxo-4-hydroxy-4-carboxy--5-ureidoimidazoline decarboxylase [Myxococcales bacterium]